MLSPTSPAALPNELWCEIFSHLEIDDLKNVRLVCSRFKDLSQRADAAIPVIYFISQCIFKEYAFNDCHVEVSQRSIHELRRFCDVYISQVVRAFRFFTVAKRDVYQEKRIVRSIHSYFEKIDELGKKHLRLWKIDSPLFHWRPKSLNTSWLTTYYSLLSPRLLLDCRPRMTDLNYYFKCLSDNEYPYQLEELGSRFRNAAHNYYEVAARILSGTLLQNFIRIIPSEELPYFARGLREIISQEQLVHKFECWIQTENWIDRKPDGGLLQRQKVVFCLLLWIGVLMLNNQVLRKRRRLCDLMEPVRSLMTFDEALFMIQKVRRQLTFNRGVIFLQIQKALENNAEALRMELFH